jgi:hypothetical protein
MFDGNTMLAALAARTSKLTLPYHRRTVAPPRSTAVSGDRETAC